eukprot:TRINITY_DN4898_c0_g2_i3.p2 TRINITY_DN4898_c0_g2~~TRINITY_DN4898_c0_g2_i3.p2  ORF type:complete len:133 (-),score=19.36 TRINITY_DN4898_c0_g2_i3:15-413(-)
MCIRDSKRLSSRLVLVFTDRPQHKQLQPVNNPGPTLVQPSFNTWGFRTTPSRQARSVHPKSVSQMRSEKKNDLKVSKNKQVQELARKYEFNEKEHEAFADFLQLLSALDENTVVNMLTDILMDAKELKHEAA